MNARPSNFASSKVDPRVYRVGWELRHARIRLALAENELRWAEEALVAGYLNADAALQILEQQFDALAGAKP